MDGSGTLAELAGCTRSCTGRAARLACTWQAIKQARKLNPEFYNFTKHIISLIIQCSLRIKQKYSN